MKLQIKVSLTIGLATLILLCLFSPGAFVNAGQEFDVVLRVETPPLAWGESTVDRKIQSLLSRSPSTRVYLAEKLQEGVAPYPADRYHLDSLVNWGLETGHRYLLAVYVEDEWIERRKTFSIPLIFHRYEVIATIKGELQLIDITRNRRMLSESFSVQERGKRVFQASFDDEIHDPAIHMPAAQKIRFFDALEDKLARHIEKKIRNYARGR